MTDRRFLKSTIKLLITLERLESTKQEVIAQYNK